MYTNHLLPMGPLRSPPQQQQQQNYDKQNFEIVSTKSLSDQDQNMYD